jgi:hypothetical protein
MIQNLALGGFPLIAVDILQSKEDNLLEVFHLQSLFFYFMCCICMILVIFLETADRVRGNNLTKKDFRATYISKVMKE